MIIDVHRHLVLKGTVQGAYIKGASRSFSMMYNKAHKTNLSPRTYIDEIMRKEIDQDADNVIVEMDRSGVEVSVTRRDHGLRLARRRSTSSIRTSSMPRSPSAKGRMIR
jgi:hypothetical protein